MPGSRPEQTVGMLAMEIRCFSLCTGIPEGAACGKCTCRSHATFGSATPRGPLPVQPNQGLRVSPKCFFLLQDSNRTPRGRFPGCSRASILSWQFPDLHHAYQGFCDRGEAAALMYSSCKNPARTACEKRACSGIWTGPCGGTTLSRELLSVQHISRS